MLVNFAKEFFTAACRPPALYTRSVCVLLGEWRARAVVCICVCGYAAPCGVVGNCFCAARRPKFASLAPRAPSKVFTFEKKSAQFWVRGARVGESQSFIHLFSLCFLRMARRDLQTVILMKV